ncbi:MAG: hypothetical protein RLZZ400_250 [Actinomycetota bacterium]|jgi:MFS family permease
MSETLSPERLRRARIALLAIFFTQGFAAITTLPRIPELIHQIDVNFAVWGAIIGFSGLGSLPPLIFTNRLVNRFGTSPVIRLSAIAIVIAQFSLGWIHNPAIFFGVYFLQSFAFSTFNIALNAQAVMLQNKLGRVILAAMHGAWSTGAAASAAVSGILAGFMPLWLHLIIVPGLCFIAFQIAGRVLLTPAEDNHAAEKARSKGLSWAKTPGYLWFLAIGLFAGMWPELVLMDWSAIYSRDVLQIDATRGAVPYTVFTAAMIIGRFAVGPLTKRMQFATISAIGGFAGATAMAFGVYFSATLASTNVDLAFALQIICYIIGGLGAASMVPSFYSAGGEVRGLSTAQALSRMSLANALIVMFSKWLMGGLVETNGIVLAMIFPIVSFFAAGIIATYVSINGRRIKERAVQAYPPTGPISTIDVADD